jgi:hypothetical protein
VVEENLSSEEIPYIYIHIYMSVQEENTEKRL